MPFALVYKPVRLGGPGACDTDVCGSTDGAVASASINACSIASSNRRITSPPAAQRSASVNSSRADWPAHLRGRPRSSCTPTTWARSVDVPTPDFPDDVLLPVIDLLTRLPWSATVKQR